MGERNNGGKWTLKSTSFQKPLGVIILRKQVPGYMIVARQLLLKRDSSDRMIIWLEKCILGKNDVFFLHIKATPCWSAGREKIPSSSLDIHGDLLGCWKCIVCCCSNHNMARYCTGWSIVILHCLKCECVPIIEKASRRFSLCIVSRIEKMIFEDQ